MLATFASVITLWSGHGTRAALQSICGH